MRCSNFASILTNNLIVVSRLDDDGCELIGFRLRCGDFLQDHAAAVNDEEFVLLSPKKIIKFQLY